MSFGINLKHEQQSLKSILWVMGFDQSDSQIIIETSPNHLGHSSLFFAPLQPAQKTSQQNHASNFQSFQSTTQNSLTPIFDIGELN